MLRQCPLCPFFVRTALVIIVLTFLKGSGTMVRYGESEGFESVEELLAKRSLREACKAFIDEQEVGSSDPRQWANMANLFFCMMILCSLEEAELMSQADYN